MATVNTTDIWVYAHWKGMPGPRLIGVLTAQQAKGRKSFSFQYKDDWINSREQLLLDPDIGWYGGPQFPDKKENFGIFTDSMPDTWGRKLMQRKAAHTARTEGKKHRDFMKSIIYWAFMTSQEWAHYVLKPTLKDLF